MRDYELTYIVDPELDQEALDALIEDVKGIVESKGTVNKVELMGRLRLAYPIQQFREGQYVHMKLSMEPEGVAELEQDLKLKQSIIRYLIVRAEKG